MEIDNRVQQLKDDLFELWWQLKVKKTVRLNDDYQIDEYGTLCYRPSQDHAFRPTTDPFYRIAKSELNESKK